MTEFFSLVQVRYSSNNVSQAVGELVFSVLWFHSVKNFGYANEGLQKKDAPVQSSSKTAGETH